MASFLTLGLFRFNLSSSLTVPVSYLSLLSYTCVAPYGRRLIIIAIVLIKDIFHLSLVWLFITYALSPSESRRVVETEEGHALKGKGLIIIR